MVFIQDNNLPKKKDGAHVINLDECKSTGTHWIALYVNAENVNTFIYWSWTFSKRNLKSHRKQKYDNKYL